MQSLKYPFSFDLGRGSIQPEDGLGRVFASLIECRKPWVLPGSCEADTGAVTMKKKRDIPMDT